MNPAQEGEVHTSIEVTCENGHTFRVKRKYVGRQGKCPECSASVLVPKMADTQGAAGGELETLGERKDDAAGATPAANAAQELGRFRIERVLGEGAFGTVYLAHDPQLDRQVALKVPRRGSLGDKKEAERFLREARTAAQLRHPNIVPVYDAGEIDGTYYIASAFVPPGRTLHDLMREEKQLEPDRASRLIERLARALDYAHSLGIVHRDVKPDNILLDESGAPHVADFGLARREEAAALRTQENVRMGTPAYMSPEQHAGKSRDADARSDMWALGVTLYAMLTGERPFQGDDVQLMYAVRELEPEPPRKKDPSVPRDLETICLKCLVKEPDGRYAACAELAEDLRRWRDNEPISARRVTATERLWSWSKRNPAIARLVAAIVIVTVLGLGGILWKWADAESHRSRAEGFASEAGDQRDEAKRQATLADANEAIATQKQQELGEANTLLEEANSNLEEAKESLTRQNEKLARAQAEAEQRKKEAEENAEKFKEQRERADQAAEIAQTALALPERDKQALEAQLYLNNVALADREIPLRTES